MIVEDKQLQNLRSRILELCRARLRYELPCRNTVGNDITLLGKEGKVIARDFLVRLIKSGVKPTISVDLQYGPREAWASLEYMPTASLRLGC